MNYEEMKASSQNLKFCILESKLKETLGIEKITSDILKTLNLLDKNKYYIEKLLIAFGLLTRIFKYLCLKIK